MTIKIKRFLKILRLEVELFVILITGLIYIFIDKIKPHPIIPADNILFIQIYGIGNFVLCSTMQSAIREHFQNKKIIAVVHPQIKELATKCPYLDEVIVYEDRSLSGKIKLINQLRQTNFALAIDLSGTYWTAWLCRLSRAPKRVGFNAVGVQRLWFNRDGSGRLYTKGIPFNHNIYMKEFYDNFLSELNIPLKDKDLKIFPSQEDDKFATQLLKEFKDDTTISFITIHIGARQKERLWSVEKFAGLISELLKKRTKIILTGASNDIERGNRILSLVNSRSKDIISIIGKTTLYQLTSIIAKSDLFIGHDSGPMHLACAVKTPLIALFGPGVVELWRPYLKESIVIQSNVQCRGCNKIGHFYNCKENVCMSQISVEQVLNAVETIMKKG
ncbi:MAG: glycosyltransferase family 9 protein [bacterium]